MRKIWLAVLLVCTFSIGFVAGQFFVKTGANQWVSSLGNSENVNMDLFWNVWNQMKTKYVDSSKSDSTKMLYGAIKGMVNSYDDPATVFLSPKETEDFNNASEGKYFEGIGAELGYDNGQVIVVSPIEGSPAKAAGIRPGDYILAIDGQEVTSSMTVYDVVGKIRGKSGTEVTIKILHKGDTSPVDIKIVRKEITVPSMTLEFKGENNSVAYFKVSRFTDASFATWTSIWDKNVDEIVNSKVDKMILDLRGNPGGYFDAAVYAADDFLDKGQTIAQQQDSEKNVQKYESKAGGKLLNIKLVVLVDNGSASASEILSGALKQSNRAQIIGDKTYGKGTAQSVVNLPGGSTLHITILKWLLPDGTWINRDNSITPNIEVKFTDEDFLKGTDPQLDRALQEIQK